jgi:hypothetical protein
MGVKMVYDKKVREMFYRKNKFKLNQNIDKKKKIKKGLKINLTHENATLIWCKIFKIKKTTNMKVSVVGFHDKSFRRSADVRLLCFSMFEKHVFHSFLKSNIHM